MPTREDASSFAPGSFESLSFEALLTCFLEEMRGRHYSFSHQSQAARVLPDLFSHLREQGLADVRAVGEEHLARYARELKHRTTKRGTPLSPWSQADYLDLVRGFFAFLVRRGVLLVNPAQGLRVPRRKALPRAVLSETQARRLMNAASPWTTLGQRDRAILETLYGTGLRAGECVRLEVTDLDLGQRTLLVRNGKGRKDRLVPVGGRAAIALDAYLQTSRPELLRDPHEAALFVSRYGRRLGVPGLRQIVRSRAKDAGLPRAVFSHALRHTCATHLLRGGADIRHVQELLGHKRLQTTAVYTRVGIEDLRQVIARSHPREKRERMRCRPGLKRRPG